MSEVKRYLRILGEGTACAWTEVVRASDFDAKRLRADTAEAALKIAVEDVAMMLKDLDAAEQRIANTVAKLQLAVDMLDDDDRGNRFAQVLQLAIAALNPNPEAESHE